jgi:hypothetical protein
LIIRTVSPTLERMVCDGDTSVRRRLSARSWGTNAIWGMADAVSRSMTSSGGAKRL